MYFEIKKKLTVAKFLTNLGDVRSFPSLEQVTFLQTHFSKYIPSNSRTFRKRKPPSVHEAVANDKGLPGTFSIYQKIPEIPVGM